MTQSTAFTIITATADEWSRIPLIYEADGYDRAAAGMRDRSGWEIDEFRNGDRLLLFAEAGGQPVATVGLVFRGRDAGRADGVSSANINRLHVIQAWRKRGVGTALMSAAEEEACERGFRQLTIELEDDNTPARALYEKLGFQYSGRGKDAANVAMVKELR
jgi:ribosomal protein S18 acetylase RimI-like enzyme